MGFFSFFFNLRKLGDDKKKDSVCKDLKDIDGMDGNGDGIQGFYFMYFQQVIKFSKRRTNYNYQRLTTIIFQTTPLIKLLSRRITTQ